MTSAGDYRRKISKSVRFCSRVVRRTIEGKIFPPIRENSEHKEKDANCDPLSQIGLKEDNPIRERRENLGREKSQMRTLDNYQQTPERPPKTIKDRRLSLQSTMKTPKPRKPRLPTPDSPTNISLSEQELACPSKIHL